MEQVVSNRVWGWGARSCMEQMVSNRVWGGVRGCVWNRWCRIMYGVRCEVVHGTGGVESFMGLRCEVVYGTGGVESSIGMGCEVVYGTGGVESCMG